MAGYRPSLNGFRPCVLVEGSRRIYNVSTLATRALSLERTMQSVIRKWGNSPALRLPSAVLKAAGYRLEQTVEITVSPGRIVIEPSDKVQYVLAEMLNAINDGNKHDEVSFGPPLGKEVL